MSEQKSQSFSGLDLLASAVVLVDDDYAIRYLNPAAENLVAASTKILAGHPLSEVINYSHGLQTALDEALANNWAYTGQNIELKRADGDSLQVNCTVTPVEAPGSGLLIEMWPIDQQLKASREERLLEQQQANRELIRNLAHEIKNPLGGIRGAAQLLEHELAELANAPALREYTQVIIKEADRLQDLMQRLLTPQRPMHPGPVSIHEVLERVRSLLVAEFPQALQVRRDYDTSLPDLVGDREQLIQAILNIARNAAQAMQGAGMITLRTRAARQVTLAKKRYRLAMELQVIDDGPGIPPDILERMFYPLVSGREGGSGLGLTIAQNFVQHHHGTIECESRPGHTAFIIRLPLSQA
ncbi:MAG: two-component system, NtrC family, nitrogen regulation sensor histidine kinase GlnL [Pseudomonadota bacterium]|jgi:two-component system nitrogen regulation sensor histidine kinase GlnL|nr:two-component system, NtrC family, nitrogen regulation sensor histidine kinase GlnL [Pseudomonadota bacterium]MDQ5916071.1 two-component system, NtrC family, nitrogen regulation sensor histidine kinase GlnL [Pseudomonadota bacterium]